MTNHPLFPPERRPLSRRSLLVASAATAAVVFASGASAQQANPLLLDLRSGGSFTPMPIAVTDFLGERGAEVSGVITNNLRRCGLFAPLEKSRFPEQVSNFDAAPNLQAWRTTGVQAVITGRVSREGARLKAEFRLWDATSGEQVVGQQYFTEPNAWRRVAHIISDAVFTQVTGEKGFFDTRIVFVDESGPKQNRRKRLAIIDQDGANFQALSAGGELVVTPRFSPSSNEVAFMGFTPGAEPRVYLLDISSGSREAVGNFPGMSFSPRFSPDGGRLLMSLQQGGNANIYALDLRSKAMTRLTSTGAIDTSPSFSPDGRQIVFESDRGGGQQIYVMGADGSNQRRISFGQGRYSTPVWSPKGDLIAFTRQNAGSFSIGVMKPDGTGERILTEGFHNEGPTWAPNGRYLVFFRDPGGEGGPRMYMVDITGRVNVPVPTPGFASDPAWSPLLTETR